MTSASVPLDLLTPDRRERLLEFLGSLPNATAAKLFAALEADRARMRAGYDSTAFAVGARGGKGLPHDALLESLREQLAANEAAFPARPLTAQRLFFAPFEDFLVAFRTGKKRRARIARASLTPIWTLVQTDPACSSAARAAGALDQAIRDGSANVDAYAEAMFNAAGQGIARLVAHTAADETFHADLAERLGGEAALGDLAEIDLLMAAVEHLCELQRTFPKPVSGFTEEELFEARRLYAAAKSEAPQAAPYLLLALAARMEAPWRALSVYYHFAGARDEALGAAGEAAGVIVETLFEDLEGAARMLERDAAGEFDGEDARLRLRHFAEFAEGVAKEAERAGDNVVLNRVEACRDIAGESLSRFCEQSLAALRRAMPVRHAGGSSRLMALRPDFARPLSPRTVFAAREAASFLTEAERIAGRLGRMAAAGGVIDDAIDEARRYAGDLVTEIRAAEGEDRASARRLMTHVLEFAAPLLPEDEISLLRERARAAALTA